MEKKERWIRTFVAALSGALLMLLALAAVLWLRFGGEGLKSVWKYAQVLRLVEQDYIGGDYEPRKATDAALSAVIGHLDDDWSYYMDAESYRAYRDYSANQYQGIGVTIQKHEASGGFLLVSLEPEGPAARAGVKVGEIILACDGTDVTGGDTAALKALIQAAYGRSVVLTLQGEDGGVREVAVSCEVVQTVPVQWQRLEDGLGYVRIENFEQGAGAAAIEAVEALIGEGVSGLIFDVRSNPGGRVTELCELLDYLLPEGDIFIRADKKGRETVERSDARCVELPMAVLLNGESYSAAEFFAAALKEYDWAEIVGEASSGKGRSQVTYALPDGSAVHISCYVYLTPERIDLSRAGGLRPDRLAKLSPEKAALLAAGQLLPEADPQLQAARDWLVAGCS